MRSLAELCDGLLQRDPALRAGAHEVRRCFSDFSPERVLQTELHSAIVGRAGELRALEDALAKVTASGAGALVAVEGDSGIGKTALVRALVERARAEGNWVLTGRCYETESVPFKAFDQMLDDLARALKARGKEGLARYRPRHAGLLAKVFPALALLTPKRITDSLPPADPAELKARATRALLELFERMAEDHPVVVCAAPERARDLLRLSGEQFLLSGDLQQGLLVLQQALADHQLSLSPSASAALLETMTLIAQLTERGLVAKQADERDPHAESRVQLCLSIARCLHHVDLRGLPFALRALLEALDLGSESLLQQACATFVMVTAGHLPNPMIEAAFAQCRALTSKLAHANAQALLYMAEVEIEHFRGRYTAAERACERAERTLINHCVGVSRELGQIRSTLLIMAHSDRGDFSANAERALGWLEDADRRSDKFYGNWLRAAYSLVWMAQDMPARARADIARAEAEWPAAKGGTFETACALYLDALARYEDLPNVHENAAQGRKSVLESPVVHTPLLQGYLHLHRAWGCLRELGARPKAHSEEARVTMRKTLEHAITSLRKLGLPSWHGTADACEANLRLLDGDRNEADCLLERAYGTLADAHHHALAACARRRLAEVVDGDLGRRWQAEADAELQRLGVSAPARFTRAYFSPFSATSYERCSEPTSTS